MTRYELSGADGTYIVEVTPEGEGFRISTRDRSYFLRLRKGTSEGSITAEVADKPIRVTLREADSQRVELVIGGERLTFTRLTQTPGSAQTKQAPFAPPTGVLVAPMPGRVISLMTENGEEVEAGDPLVVIESMKMETAIRSDRKGTVEEILVTEGSTVKRGQPLVRFRT